MYAALRPYLFRLEPERAHKLALRWADIAADSGIARLLLPTPAKPFPVKAFGLMFPNPVGLAAGLDKNGDHIKGLFALGFGSVEIGTITPRPQPGNPQPRLFRLPEHQAIINRMGFNNDGVDALVRNVQALQRRPGILGINIGKNKDTENENAASDYLHCMERVYPLADYITVNISSPNTAGLRELQEEQQLRSLLGALREAQERLGAQHGKRVPLLVKIAPDLSDEDLDAAARVLADMEVDGVIATNTTVSRQEVQQHVLAQQVGGLSGAPLLARSTAVLRRLRIRLPESIPLVGVGGILSGADAVAKTAAGAQLVQLYSGLIYRGPTLVGECVEAIRRRKEAPASGRVPD
ncbi:dihydroorotate dehydrogenase (quinone) [Lysobacteraceae bacterium NML08-0793]|nr:dihydroorotate dehydrogenase (quinone) [Xanthomonadaceae bacterium NML08-0793]